MARKYGKKSGKMVKAAMEKMEEGKLRSGKSRKKVTSRKQAIAIGLSEARAKGVKMPAYPKGKKTAKRSTKKATTKRRTTKRASTKRKSSRRK